MYHNLTKSVSLSTEQHIGNRQQSECCQRSQWCNLVVVNTTTHDTIYNHRRSSLVDWYSTDKQNSTAKYTHYIQFIMQTTQITSKTEPCFSLYLTRKWDMFILRHSQAHTGCNTSVYLIIIIIIIVSTSEIIKTSNELSQMTVSRFLTAHRAHSLTTTQSI